MSKVWDGKGMTQEDFLRKDECIIVNENDVIKGTISKYDSHVFNQTNVSRNNNIIIVITLIIILEEY